MDLDIESWSPIPNGPIPTYRIDLSLPPQERYTQLSTNFSGRVRDLVPLFDSILSWTIPFPYPRRFIKFIASLFLRRKICLSLSTSVLCTIVQLSHSGLINSSSPGFRPSIASDLRSALLPPNENSPIPGLFQSVKTLQAIKSSPCYLILCSGTKTTVIERDLSTSKLRTSTQFIVHTNHYQNIPFSVPQITKRAPEPTKWAAVKTKHENKQKYEPAWKDVPPSIVTDMLISWVKTYPVMNETSHFGCVMDPSTGGL
ncbi:hypothetical protein HYFRA_00007334 [Hymenoscyphus fraxineus]|uniref:ceramidase n=1 Tax=Hymenoscyphus fraxineus TaxID=746836 RepID=A0A9N9KPB1_9HELO|nr:hypothetical protein HYFRA_00007334 [Hymenoscyphus fraxineus]